MLSSVVSRSMFIMGLTNKIFPGDFHGMKCFVGQSLNMSGLTQADFTHICITDSGGKVSFMFFFFFENTLWRQVANVEGNIYLCSKFMKCKFVNIIKVNYVSIIQTRQIITTQLVLYWYWTTFVFISDLTSKNVTQTFYYDFISIQSRGLKLFLRRPYIIKQINESKDINQ